MLLTVTTTHRPATDLGYLLVKHPDRVQSFRVSGGRAFVCYPEATDERCTAALMLELDGTGVDDRRYAATSVLAVALGQVFRSALRGTSAERPELAATAIPLEIGIPALRCRGGAELVGRLFEPLGWTVDATPVEGGRHVAVTLTGTVRLADALNQVYVLMPVLDDAKHYWVAPDEVDKLLRAGTGWLAGHPDKALIARRYLAHRRALADRALSALSEAEPDSIDEPAGPAADPRRAPLAAQRRAAIRRALEAAGATRVLDLGCGGGALLAELVGDSRYTQIVGADVSPRGLEVAARRLRFDRLPARQRDRITLVQTALTYRDDRLRGYDAAVLMEVVEHVDESRLPALVDAVFGHAHPGCVVVTTPNVEYNEVYGLTGRRHPDHRFEWDRATFSAWASGVAAAHGYQVAISGVGEPDEARGCPTQMAVFS